MPEPFRQSELFDTSQPLPHGLLYRPEFLSRTEESALLGAISELPFREARFQQYFAKRRVVHYHAAGAVTQYDASDGESFSSGPLPLFLSTLLDKVSGWIGLPPAAFVHALVSEYRPGTPIGWHRDKPVYGVVVGISLHGWGRMRFRPIAAKSNAKDVVVIDLEPRSAYVMRGPIRWDWQHSMLPTKATRYSVTFRTLAAADDPGQSRFRKFLQKNQTVADSRSTPGLAECKSCREDKAATSTTDLDPS